LHVIATGSLLEFALEDLTSWGVGRIRSVYMYPMSFDEFLLANNEDALIELKKNVFTKCLKLFYTTSAYFNNYPD